MQTHKINNNNLEQILIIISCSDNHVQTNFMNTKQNLKKYLSLDVRRLYLYQRLSLSIYKMTRTLKLNPQFCNTIIILIKAMDGFDLFSFFTVI